MLDRLANYVIAEWAVIKAAPVILFSVIVLAIAAGYAIGTYLASREISIHKATIEYLAKQLANRPAEPAVAPESQRRLSDEQIRGLATEAAKLRPEITGLPVAFANGDAESEHYVHSFIDALRRARAEPRFAWTMPDGPNDVGVKICVRNPQQAPDVAAKLRQVLKDIGVSAEIAGFPAAGFTGTSDAHKADLVLYVAPRPLGGTSK